MNNPFRRAQGRESSAKYLWIVEIDELPKKLQFTGIKRATEAFQEQPPKHIGEMPTRAMQPGLPRNPALAVRRDPASRKDAMYVWMVAPTPKIP